MKKTPHKIIYIRASIEVYDALKAEADDDERPVSAMAERIIRRHLEDVGRLPKEPALAGQITSRASSTAVASGDALAAAIM